MEKGNFNTSIRSSSFTEKSVGDMNGTGNNKNVDDSRYDDNNHISSNSSTSYSVESSNSDKAYEKKKEGGRKIVITIFTTYALISNKLPV